MRIGIFSDLHSNIYAWQAMMILEPDIEHWVCTGDFVGLLPPVNEVVAEIKAKQVIAVQGNHEQYLIKNEDIAYSFTANEAIKKQREIITLENKAYIANLPKSLTITLAGIKFFITHQLTEYKTDKYVLDLETIDEHYHEYDVVLFGDTHLPLIAYSKNVIVINPGSVGFPVDKLKQPSYAIFNTKDFTCRLKRFDFNKEKLLQDIQEQQYNDKLYHFINSGFHWD